MKNTYEPLLTVQQLIDKLNGIQDKTLPVRMTIHLDPQYPNMAQRDQDFSHGRDPFTWIDGVELGRAYNPLKTVVVLYGSEV